MYPQNRREGKKALRRIFQFCEGPFFLLIFRPGEGGAHSRFKSFLIWVVEISGVRGR